MANLQNAIEHIRHNNTPYWWLLNGTVKVGQYTKSDNLEDSIEHLKQQVGMMADGNYTIKSSDNANDHRGAVHFKFSKGKGEGITTPSMNTNAGNSSNEYGIPDHILLAIQKKTEQDFMFKQLYEKFPGLEEMLKDHGKRIEKIEKYLLDDDKDSDGVPDFLQSAMKDGVKTVAQEGVKKMFTNGSKMFGNS